jgi:enoyl-CoA hydratase/carnithine racemase
MVAAQDSSLLVECSPEGLQTITFNRPSRRNAFDNDLYVALTRALREARLNEHVKVVLITGAQGYFSAGNDLEDFIGYDCRDDFLPAAFLRELAACTKPVVAAVEGCAIGVGFTMLLHCDFIYVGRSTRLHMPFIHLNVCPEGGSSFLVPAWAGARRAARWLLLGEPFDALQAQDADLVTEVLDDGATLAQAQAVALRLAAMDPAALQTTKRLLRGDLPALQSTMAVELECFTDLLARPPAQAALVRMTQRKNNSATTS